MNNEKMLEEILILRKIKERLNEFRHMSNNEKSTFLMAIESYEDYLSNYIQTNNNNIKLMKEDGIEPTNKEILVPIDEKRSNYENLRTYGMSISLLKRIVYLDDVLFSLPTYIMALNIPQEEEKMIYKSLKNYAEELNMLKQERENNKRNNPDLYEEKEEYVPLTQREMMNLFLKKSMNIEENKDKSIK